MVRKLGNYPQMFSDAALADAEVPTPHGMREHRPPNQLAPGSAYPPRTPAPPQRHRAPPASGRSGCNAHEHPERSWGSTATLPKPLLYRKVRSEAERGVGR